MLTVKYLNDSFLSRLVKWVPTNNQVSPIEWTGWQSTI
jgi:hypothetical protein